MSKTENSQNARMLRDDELAAVNGGLNLENTMVSGFSALEEAKAEAQAFSRGTSVIH